VETFLEQSIASPELAIAIAFPPRAVVLTIVGEIDLSTEVAVKTAVARGLAHSDPTMMMQIDVAGVSFIDSSGVRSLLLARQAVLDHGLEFALRAPADGLVARRLNLCGLNQVFGRESAAP
jgi:anti-sigma B factor antagonist